MIGCNKLKLNITYKDNIAAFAQVLFIKIQLYPKKKRIPRPNDFKIKRFRKTINRNLKRYESNAEKAQRKAEKKKLKKTKGTTETPEDVSPKPKKKKDIKPLLRMLIRILKAFIAKFPRYLQTDVKRLVIGVASDDAANTALTYGYTVQAIQYAVSFVKCNSNLRQTKNSVVSVYPDFTTEKWVVDVDITFSIRVYQVIALGISLALAYLGMGKYKK